MGEPTPPEAPVEPEAEPAPAPVATDPDHHEDLLVEEDLLIEEVSIDGMCGVY